MKEGRGLEIKNSFKPILVCVLLLPGIEACIRPYDVEFDFTAKVVVIDANITDLPNQSFVRLRESIPSGSGSFIRGLEEAKVYLLENESNTIDLVEGENSFYFPPLNFQGQIGNSYQLFIELANGSKYESNVEELIDVPPIKEIFYENDAEGVEINDFKYAAQSIYLNTDDPENERNFYAWSWELYEKQSVCITCEGGRYFTDPSPEGRCEADQFLTRRGVAYDYICNSDCFEIIRSEKINTQGDQFTNGLQVSNVLLGVIPYYVSSNGYLVVNQQAISRGAFDYSARLKGVGQNTGGLADTPPAPLIGNISHLNGKDIVSGYFIVGATSRKQVILDRSEFIASRLRPLGLLGGRLSRPEPTTSGPTDRPPLAPCLESRNRTRTLPIGF